MAWLHLCDYDWNGACCDAENPALRTVGHSGSVPGYYFDCLGLHMVVRFESGTPPLPDRIIILHHRFCQYVVFDLVCSYEPEKKRRLR